MILKRILVGLALSLLAACSGGGASSIPTPPPAPASWTITNGTVSVTAEVRFGASVTHVLDAHGFDYDNIVDHGREWQVAYQLDGLDEGYNPTEAGSAADAAGPTSTSVVVSASTPAPNMFTSVVKPAYWYPYQGALVSPDTVSKTVTLGVNGLSNVIRWDVAVVVATDHPKGWYFEGLAGTGPYLPLLYVLQTDGSWELTAQTHGGTVVPPLSFVTASQDGSQALGVLGAPAPMLQWAQLDPAGDSSMNGWGCAGWQQTPLPAGTYSATCYVAIGTLAEVESSLSALKAAGM